MSPAPHRRGRPPRPAAQRGRAGARGLAWLVCVAFASGCGPGDPIAEVRALHARGEYEASLAPLRELVEDGRADAESLYLYGVALAATRRPTEAVWPLRRALEDPAWKVAASLQLAEIAIATTDWDGAIAVVDPLIEADAENSRALLLRAYARAQSRTDWPGTLADADRVLALDPENSDALVLRAVALLGEQRIDEAGEAIEVAALHFDEVGLGLARSPRFCAVRATFAKEKKDLAKAKEIFEQCVEEFPVDYVVVDEATKFFDEQGDHERALEVLQAAFEGLPDFRTYRLSLVGRLTTLGRHDEAEKLVRDATDVAGREASAAAFADLAGYYFERGRLDDALSAFERALERVPDPGPEFMFTYADTLVAAGRTDEALAVAERMTVAPHRELVRGRVALERGDPERALVHFTEGLRLWPENAVARWFAAQAAEQIGDFDRAIEEYRYSLRADPLATEARMRLARLYEASGEYELALEAVRHDAERQPPPSLDHALYELELLARLGRADTLPTRLLGVLERPEVWPRAIEAMARGVRAERGPAAAVRIVQNADRVDPKRPVNALVLASLSGDLVALGRGEDALARVEAALAAHPEAAALHAIRGDVLAGTGAQAASVRAAYERALELDAANAVALRGLAALRAREGDAAGALTLYEQASAADPADAIALRAATEIALAQGQRSEAEAFLRELLAREPYDGPAALALAELRLAADPTATDRETTVLLRAASRFGGGEEANRLLARVEGAQAAAATR